MTAVLKQQVVGQHVQRLRQDAGVSLRRFASLTGFSPSFISQLENGLVSPSIGSMEKIAAALGVTLGEFFVGADGGEGGQIVRASDRPTLSSGWSKAQIEALTVARPTGRLEATVVTLFAGGRSGKHPHASPREEVCLVLEGEVVLTLGPEEHVLRKGDAATILPGELRLWRNERRRTARVAVVAAAGGRVSASGRRAGRRPARSR
jgi:transcriptional regulator with XRE-family HTH domain